jgi:hypothetical protein
MRVLRNNTNASVWLRRGTVEICLEVNSELRSNKLVIV